jgi:hypothetical protein
MEQNVKGAAEGGPGVWHEAWQSGPSVNATGEPLVRYKL